MEFEEKERRAKIVVDDSEGIRPVCEAFYIHSIIYSARRCLNSFDRYDCLKDGAGDPESLISILQEAVGHAAALSRYFWPSKNSKKGKYQKVLKESRGAKLLHAFNLDNDSPLYNRDLRNAWEHFDERLDSYLLEAESGFFHPDCLSGSHELVDNNPSAHIFKLLDQDAECLVLMGDKYFFTLIREEVQRILSKAESFDNRGTRIS